MPQEAQSTGENANRILEVYINTPGALQQLIVKPKPEYLEKVGKDVDTLSPEDTNLLTRTVLQGISRESPQWDVDRRDGGIELLRLINPEKLDPKAVYSAYENAIQRQTDKSDVYGTVYSVLEAGKVLAGKIPIFVSNERALRSVLSQMKTLFSSQEYGEYLTGEIEQIASQFKILPDPPREIAPPQEKEKLGFREQPSFDDDEQFLYEKYLESVRTNGTFKIDLWQNTPEFRTECAKYGIDIAHFWNITNPDQVQEAISKLKGDTSDSLKTAVNKILKRRFNLSLDDITEESSRYLADEIIACADEARSEFLHADTEGNQLEKLKSLIKNTMDAPPRAKRLAIRDVSQYLHSIGYESDSPITFEELSSILQEPSVIEMAQLAYQRRQDLRRTSADSLDRLFGLSQLHKNISLISRTRDDLYLGDLTNDCTAFHHETGFNAWTLPNWLSDPGFNFFIVKDDNGKMIAKFGTMLAIENDSTPVLVIDSSELEKNIGSEEYFGQKYLAVESGLIFLDQWAKKIGLQKVYIEPLANNENLNEELRSQSEKHTGSESLNKLGGLRGLFELRKNLGSSIAGSERTYSQAASAQITAETEEDEEEILEIRDYMEDQISKVLRMLNTEEKKEFEIEARNGNWNSVERVLITNLCPVSAEIFGNNSGDYTPDMPVKASNQLDAMIKDYEEGNFPYSLSTTKDLNYEATELGEFLDTLERLKQLGTTPETVLQTIYNSGVYPDSDGNVSLKKQTTGLRVLKPRIIELDRDEDVE